MIDLDKPHYIPVYLIITFSGTEITRFYDRYTAEVWLKGQCRHDWRIIKTVQEEK